MTEDNKKLVEARKFAVQALQARLKMGDPKSTNDKLKRRIAAIRAGTLDTAPEVQSALLAAARIEALMEEAAKVAEEWRSAARALSNTSLSGTEECYD